MLLTPNRLQKRPRIPNLHNKPDEVEARLDILILACIANVGFHDTQAPANAYSTPINGQYPITYVNQAFTEEWVKEVQTIRTNDNTRMTHEEMVECFVKDDGPEKANQLLKKHEWTKTRPNPQFRFVGQKWKNKNKSKQTKWSQRNINNEATQSVNKNHCFLNNLITKDG